MRVVKLTDDQLEYVIAAVEAKLEDAADHHKTTLCQAIEAILEQLDNPSDE